MRAMNSGTLVSQIIGSLRLSFLLGLGICASKSLPTLPRMPCCLAPHASLPHGTLFCKTTIWVLVLTGDYILSLWFSRCVYIVLRKDCKL